MRALSVSQVSAHLAIDPAFRWRDRASLRAAQGRRCPFTFQGASGSFSLRLSTDFPPHSNCWSPDRCMQGWDPVTSAAQFFSFAEAAPLVCVYITAPWCFRCRQVFEKVAGFPADHASINFYSVDLEECEELGELLDIRTLPTFVLLRDGAEVARLEGAPQQRPARRLAQAIRQHLLGEAAASSAGGAENVKSHQGAN